MTLYAEACPAILKYASVVWRTRFEFADYLLIQDDELPAARITNTVVRRTPQPLTFDFDSKHRCKETGCEAKGVRRWLSSRRGCYRSACPTQFGDVWTRLEQKQVDTHLSMDLVGSVLTQSMTRHVGLVSDDNDFLPILIGASQLIRQEGSITQIRPTMGASYLDDELLKRGVQLIFLAERSE